MALSDWFKGRGGDKSGENGDAEGGGGAPAFTRDPRKARRFFEHAQTVADARNYDYAVECYVQGLRHDPDNINKHEELYEVAKRRKVSGGKPPGLKERFKSGGSDPVEKMLHAELLWAKDPTNTSYMLEVMKHAVESDKHNDSLNLAEVAYWVGGLTLQGLQGKSDKKSLLSARDLFVEIGAYDKAVEACRRAVALDPNNAELLQDLKNLEAENTMQKGGYSGAKASAGGYRQFVRDADKQRALEQEDAISKTASAADDIIKRRRAEYEEDPQDLDRLSKLVDALLARETEETEKQAVDLLRQAWEESGQYRHKMRIGDVQMKQLNRQQRQLRAELQQQPDDADVKARLKEHLRKQLEFELKEYEDRVKNYPTDMGLRFELGKRLYQAGRVDDAIGAFQQAKADPKQRAASHMFLGSCYLHKGWQDEAVETLNEGIEHHPLDDDKLALDMRYLLMDAMYQSAAKTKDLAKAKESQKVASKILQTNINYRDIRNWMDKVKQLVEQLSK
jgi:tetratricopeptide (TPR) repeat protein